MVFFTCNGLRLYCEISGSGEPILLINGLSGDTRSMAPLARELSRSFTVINFDMRCAGQSDKPDLPFTIADAASDAFQLLTEIDCDRASVLGFSMGGMTAMELFRLHREAVDRIFLVAAPPSFARPFPVPNEMIALMRRTDVSPSLLNEVYVSMFGSRYRREHPVEDYIRMRMEDERPQPVHAYLRQLEACESFDGAHIAGTIDVPVHIVAGAEDRLVPREAFNWLHRETPESRITVLEEVGHVVPLEAPQELAQVVRDEFSRKGSS